MSVVKKIPPSDGSRSQARAEPPPPVEVKREVLESPEPPTKPDIPCPMTKVVEHAQSAMTALQHRTTWMPINRLETIALTIPISSVSGLVAFYIICADNFARLSSNVHSIDAVRNEARIIVRNDEPVDRQIQLNWL